jgi:rod shape-determining protein MreC
MTVVNNAGLVGRVIGAGRSSATVLLLVDQDSVVGARLGSNAEVGMVSGRGSLDGDGRLDLDLVDNTQTPGKDDVVVTWGSRNGTPYVAGVPIGTVEAVFSSPREQAKHAVVTPFVDFSSLDLVGVVVTGDAVGDRPVIEAGRLPAREPAAGPEGED